MRLMALLLIVAMTVLLMASCKVGNTYVDEAGSTDAVTVIGKDQQVEVPYTGDPLPGDVHYTDDPAYADQGGSGSSDTPDDTDDGEDAGNTDSGDTDEGEDTDDSGSGDADYSDLKGDKSGTAIRMMSQNIRTGSSLTGTGDGEDNQIGLRRYRFKALVEKYDPDIICTQEVTPLWIQEFENLLPEYDMVWKMRSDKSKEATPVHWKKDKYEMVSYEHFWLSPTPNVESVCYGETGIPGRITTEVLLKDKATGVQFYVTSTHWGLGGGAVVIGCGNQLADRTAKLPKGTYSFILGDYNDSYQSTEYFSYCDMERLVDLRDIAQELAALDLCKMGDMHGTFSGFNTATITGSSNFIDHCLAKPNNKMAVDFYGILYDQMDDPANGVGAGFVSDHYAVLLDVRINTSKSYADFYGTAG